MTAAVNAVYENGVLRLKEPLKLTEGEGVRVIVFQKPEPGSQKTPYEIICEIAALAGEPEPGAPVFSGRDHDRILYGKAGAK